MNLPKIKIPIFLFFLNLEEATTTYEILKMITTVTITTVTMKTVTEWLPNGFDHGKCTKECSYQCDHNHTNRFSWNKIKDGPILISFWIYNSSITFLKKLLIRSSGYNHATCSWYFFNTPVCPDWWDPHSTGKIGQKIVPGGKNTIRFHDLKIKMIKMILSPLEIKW